MPRPQVHEAHARRRHTLRRPAAQACHCAGPGHVMPADALSTTSWPLSMVPVTCTHTRNAGTRGDLVHPVVTRSGLSSAAHNTQAGRPAFAQADPRAAQTPAHTPPAAAVQPPVSQHLLHCFSCIAQRVLGTRAPCKNMCWQQGPCCPLATTHPRTTPMPLRSCGSLPHSSITVTSHSLVSNKRQL